MVPVAAKVVLIEPVATVVGGFSVPAEWVVVVVVANGLLEQVQVLLRDPDQYRQQ